ncbi:UDP-glucose 6-dehydrogenase [Alteribacter lacisalsi]|uniref:UDP-glucose 6-dehydrogenase n=1 Tax=Alteribacter lacisalsi TaxID=2045244 RepID=A0A2W0HG56_9BACI|nr:UDP-glucose/GDP-mannose dehydrogenase family protein [Alteribacter lacisalsi]PYZ95779.1 UDP-glucose 6-dehydrogenase [Alteribacter lacisalsi]
MKAAVVGTGYVGLVTGVVLARLGHQVTCIDKDPEKVAKLAGGIPTIHEEGLGPMLSACIDEGRLTFTTAYDEGCPQADVVFIAVGTPEDSEGKANLTFVRAAAESIGDVISGRTVVVTKSTVPPGTNRKVKQWVADKAPAGTDIAVVSNPEFLRQGSAVYDTFHADRLIIGAEDIRAGDLVEKLFAPLEVPVLRTDLESAELIKYASNTFLAMKISFINEMAQIADRIGADVTKVAKGMGMDRRISPDFLKAGIGYGGSCFPKDTKALTRIAEEAGYEFTYGKATDHVNDQQKNLLVEKALFRFGSLKDMNITLLGLSFKPGTDDMREAPSLSIIESLMEEGANVTVYDPVAAEKAAPLLPETVVTANDLKESLDGSDSVFLVTEWDEFKQMDLSMIASLCSQNILFDERNVFTEEDVKSAGIEYHSVGRRSVYPEEVVKTAAYYDKVQGL